MIGLVQSFWRVSQAAEDAPFDYRYRIAQGMSYRDLLLEAEPTAWLAEMRSWERELAYAPWRGKREANALAKANEADPIRERGVPLGDIQVDMDLDVFVDATFGYVLSEEERRPLNEMLKEAERKAFAAGIRQGFEDRLEREGYSDEERRRILHEALQKLELEALPGEEGEE